MAKRKINIIGAGRLGKTFGRLLHKADAHIVGVCNRSKRSSDEAVAFIGQGATFAAIEDLPAADFVLISTADEQIEECVKALMKAPRLARDTVVAHCGGAISSEILAPLRARGCHVASLHPMHSFADPALSVEHFAGTFCALEGDKVAVDLVGDLLVRMGAVLSQIDPAKKALYHAGGVMASNFLVTLFDKSMLCLKASGASDDVARQIVMSLMRGSLQNLCEVGSAERALTGPIKRGEAAIVAMHLAAMPNENVEAMYRALGLATLDIARLPLESEAKVRQVLSSANTSQP